MTVVPGSRLGPYQVIALIGDGGMGRVHEARDTRLDRTVALKVLAPELSADPTFRSRLAREARAISSLNHPHICTLHDVGSEGEVDYLVMEFVDGPTLAERLADGPLPETEAVALGRQLVDGLRHAHAHGVVHLDLKPANIKLTGEGRLKIVDFGVARVALPVSDRTTRSGHDTAAVTGTLPYMAPEQLLGGEVDARTDVYGLGAVLYEMATGEPPFVAQQQVRLMDAILHDPPAPPSKRRPGLSPAFDRLALKCLEKAAVRRYQSVDEAGADLERLGRVAGAVAGTSRTAPRRRWLLATATALVVGAIVWSLVPNAGRRRSASMSSAAVPAVAVLPFVDMSAAQDQGYLSDGLAEEVIQVLGRIPGLRVTGRTSSFQFRGRPEDIRRIGQALGVTAVLEGSVRKEGDTVRIAVQLVEASTGLHLWSESYDRQLTGVFAVQDQIAHAVAGALRVTLVDARRQAPVASAQAYNAYLLGRHHYRRQSKESLARAVESFGQAVALEPGFARAWVGLAAAHAYQAGVGYVPTDDGFAQARAALTKALSLDPDSAEAHSTLGWVRMSYDWDWSGARAAYLRARGLDPGLGNIEGAQLALAVGNADEALALARRGVELDPLSTQAHFTLGLTAFYLGHLGDATAVFRRLLALNPEVANAHGLLAQIALLSDRPRDALTEALQERDPYWRLPALALAHHALGQQAEAEAAIAEFIDRHADVGAFQIAQVHAFGGRGDEALSWLERGYAQHDGGMFLLRADPILRRLASNQRYAALLAKLHLAE